MSYLRNTLRSTLRMWTMRRIELADLPNSPALVAIQWIAVGGLFVADYVLIPGAGYYQASAVALMACGIVVSALLAAWIARRGSDALRFVAAFLLSALVVGLLWLVMLLPIGLAGEEALVVIAVLFGWWLVALLMFVARACEARLRWPRAAAAVFIVVLLMSGAQYFPLVDGYLAARAYDSEEGAADRPAIVEIDPETLWPAQPKLVQATIERMRKERASGSQTFVLAVAAGGSQQLFGREATAMQGLLARRFGPGVGSVLLSNAAADLNQVPLANGSNLAAVLHGIHKSYDARRGLVIVYLTSHGGRDAGLQTDLPDYSRLRAISAQSLAAALDTAGIRRRVVIVSACYSGTWIKPLASPDTIVITASAADRTSFGCDDRRQYTVFGEAMIKGGLANGASLEQAYAQLKRDVEREETAQGATPSLPQVFVGERMHDVWTGRGSAHPAR